MTTPAQHARVWRNAEETLGVMTEEVKRYRVSSERFRIAQIMLGAVAQQYEALAQELEKEA